MIQHLIFAPITTIAVVAATVILIMLIVELAERRRAALPVQRLRRRRGFRPRLISGGRPDRVLAEPAQTDMTLDGETAVEKPRDAA